jgi:hypothetical protein
MYEGDRIGPARRTIHAVVDVDSAINDKGSCLHFLNEPDSTDFTHSAADFDRVWAGVRFRGRTRQGLEDG